MVGRSHSKRHVFPAMSDRDALPYTTIERLMGDGLEGSIEVHAVSKNDEDCETCKFNLNADDEKVRCEFLKLLGKPTDAACEKYESK